MIEAAITQWHIAAAKFRSEEGAGIVEYVLLIVAVAIVALVGILLLGGGLNAIFSDVNENLSGRSPGA